MTERRREWFTVGQAAEIVGVPDYVIRFWHREFRGYLGSRRTRGRWRMFHVEDVETFKRIHKLMHVRGYNTKGARRVLQGHSDACPTCAS